MVILGERKSFIEAAVCCTLCIVLGGFKNSFFSMFHISITVMLKSMTKVRVMTKYIKKINSLISLLSMTQQKLSSKMNNISSNNR